MSGIVNVFNFRCSLCLFIIPDTWGIRSDVRSRRIVLIQVYHVYTSIGSCRNIPTRANNYGTYWVYKRPIVSIQKYIISDDSGIDKPENILIFARKFEFANLFWTNACKGPVSPPPMYSANFTWP